MNKERRKLRELMGWQERFLVWMFRIAFMTFETLSRLFRSSIGVLQLFP